VIMIIIIIINTNYSIKKYKQTCILHE